ncbi:hypothetical protein FC52_GL000613 [Lactobacillus pasteurii DSM 23907 = CRBIP 24.76]|uniref:Lj965 prophage protein n=1 Tax=Lactobacillus pasteurii DSM 23907 = CRBIP 24.76 TaxID=1423790 RepID=I7JXZ2_9LACO|nr:hypothetical protein [Lactobacillus pasteurii]KRK07443.1 hypothetical protein FC52_GL000613 [Lactobacillus pasteurii DSM 23907 = CRBIP 24.76]TDG76689.1 hypothetical protein C5L33_000250 [Lactobacillus pasteurii]CCI85075.1 Lj965 prophage protein [Lactobacillus pasteurii DSM 23907 = CRBIP 24.76]
MDFLNYINHLVSVITDWLISKQVIPIILTLVTILITVHYNRKNYRANLEVRSKLEILNSINKLIAKYIVEVDNSLYLFIKGCSNNNDKQLAKLKLSNPNVVVGKITTEDYDLKLAETKKIKTELEINMETYGNCEAILDDMEKLWHVLDHDNLQKISEVATNAEHSEAEKEVSNKCEIAQKRLKDDFKEWYKNEFDKLTK